MNIYSFRKAMTKLIVTLALSLFIGGAAHALDPWTTVGASGLIDNDDLKLYSTDTSSGLLVFASGATGELNVKYNIAGTDGSGANGMRVRFRDNGAASRIVLELKRYSFNNGVTSTLATFDSNLYPVSTTSWRTVGFCIPNGGFTYDFDNYAYFINAKLTRSNTTGNTGLGAIQIGSGVANCIP